MFERRSHWSAGEVSAGPDGDRSREGLCKASLAKEWLKRPRAGREPQRPQARLQARAIYPYRQGRELLVHVVLRSHCQDRWGVRESIQPVSTCAAQRLCIERSASRKLD